MKRFDLMKAAAGALLLLPVAGALAQSPGKEEIISDPDAPSWSFEGAAKTKEVDAEALPGGKAICVTVAKGENPWDSKAKLKYARGSQPTTR